MLVAGFWGARPAQAQHAGAMKQKPATRTILTEDGHPNDDQELRQDVAARLKQAGVSVDWHRYDLAGLIDIESRVESCRHLKEMGVKLDWRQYASDVLMDMEMRASVAQRLQKMAVDVDWRKYDLQALMDMETLTQAARQLKQAGVLDKQLVLECIGSKAAASRQPGDRNLQKAASSR